MKKNVIFFCLFLLILSLFSQNTKKNNWPILKGPYLGQKQPGIIPKLFAGRISSNIEMIGLSRATRIFEFNCSHILLVTTAYLLVVSDAAHVHCSRGLLLKYSLFQAFSAFICLLRFSKVVALVHLHK